MKAMSLCSGDRIITGKIEFANPLSTKVFVSRPHRGGFGGLGTSGLVEPFCPPFCDSRTACKLTVSVTHSPSRKMFVWKAMGPRI